ncbi:MAG TPA: ATP-binding protein [Gammaproteobacteria bacterium]|nr:ATP-binding protein [Gammaproteobacteria bacterium]
MPPVLEKSLLARLGLAMATITILAFIGMLSSVIIAETTQGVAGAINQAGSLRMQSYRIATDLVYGTDMEATRYWRRTNALVKEFEQRLKSPRLAGVLTDTAGDELNDAYLDVRKQWQRKIKPVLRVYVSIVAPKGDLDEPLRAIADDPLADASRRHIRQRYLRMVDGFVADIDDFVKLLEEDAESKIQRLRLIQVISLFLTVAVVFVTMFLMHNRVLVPLRDLLSCAGAARRGDFSVRTRHAGDDELGRLGRAFNVMAEDLSKMYADLEARVREKTADLERSNRSLELLYNTTRRLTEVPLVDSAYNALLRDIEQSLGVGPSTICLSAQDGTSATRLATTRVHGVPKTCETSDCQYCLGDGATRLLDLAERYGSGERVLAVPIKENEQQYGVLLVEIPRDMQLSGWQRRLLEAVADHIAIAVNLTRRTTQDRRLALLEERNVIARELHDSLAQSLSYLKIQASRLDAALTEQEKSTGARRVVTELREGIASAYRQLRELLTTFRLQMDGRGLSAALDDAISEFRERSDLTIHLDNRIGGCQLTANEEIHVLQLIREALSNVVRHAQADAVQVSLACDQDGKVVATVEDDGVGLPPGAERRHHYGLAIMNERADSLGGTVVMEPSPEGGTRVELTFIPVHRSPA